MTTLLQFEVFGVPQPQGSSRAFVNRTTGRAIVTSSNPHLKDWRTEIASGARTAMQGLPPIEHSVSVRATFWLPRPKSVKRDEPTVKPDLDKLVRAVLDGLTHIVYFDDAQVTHIEACKKYVDDKAGVPNPVVAITVY